MSTIYVHLVFGTCTGRKMSEEKVLAELDEQRWLNDLQKLSNEELMRMYNTLSTGRYEFAKDAWYIPLEGDKRCPIMIAKGFKSPDSPQKMVEFQETAKMLEQEYRRFIDAWDFGQITQHDLEKAILDILEARSIAIIELSH
jgi:hypothetical protein